MRRIWNLLGDPGLHLLAIILALIGVAIGSSGPAERNPGEPTMRCTRCQSHHLPERPCSRDIHDRYAQAEP